ncbi:MAG: flippase [Patescibacteria group bacterium]|jgi:O-antigen/teichoic acid export membrane protein
MSLTRKIAHNTIIQIIGKSISTIIGLVVASVLFRYLGKEGYGNYTTVMVFLQFFGILVDMGLYIILTKKISEAGADENSLVSNIFTIRLISAVVFLGVAPLLVIFFPYPAVVKTGVALLSLSFLFITLNQVLQGVFQKHLKMIRVTISEILGRIVLLGGTLAAVYYDKDLQTILLVVVLGSFTNFIFTFLFSRKFVQIKLRFDFVVWKKIIWEAYPIALAILFNLVYFKADTLILSLYKTQEEVGIYGAPYKILEVLVTFPAMFAGLALPVLTYAYASMDMERFRRVLGKAFDFLSLISFPLIVGTLFIAKPVVDLIAGAEFAESAKVLQVLIIATGIIFIGNLFGNTVVVVNQQKNILKYYAAIAVISVAGYLIFIPKYSYMGAAWMTVLSELLITLSSIYVVWRSTKIFPSLKLFNKVLVACMGMAIVLYFMQGYSLVPTILAGAMTYFIILVLLKGISKEMIKEIVSMRSQ